jgi:glucans biosynthesis protein
MERTKMAVPELDRRGLLALAALLPFGALLAPGHAAATIPGLDLGAPRPFSFDALVERARSLAAAPYVPPYAPAPEIVSKITYDVHGQIRFKTDDALFADGSGAYPVTFFHLGEYFRKSVKMHVVADGAAREIAYSPDYFDMPADSIARGLPKDSGFAGFRLQEAGDRPDWRTQDWIAFAGASYFRAIGELGQYGLSARGIAVDVAASTPEEFPDFVEFYIAAAARDEDPVVICALLDGPGVSGAYRFAIRRTRGVVMDVETALFLRRDVERLGIAPLTSMFWRGEYAGRAYDDWRPEVHDSDGLALWTGAGERIWRPLNNPTRVVTSSFMDASPRGFGLLQRDRNFEHYLDGVNYDLRPSLWVEPTGGDWDHGSVELVEIPTDDEIHDNIVAFWTPAAPAAKGTSVSLSYRLHWLADEPYPAPVARTVATRIGRGGEPGQPRPADTWRFVVEFAGDALAGIGAGDKPKAVVSASRGTVVSAVAEPLPREPRWRAVFDLQITAGGPTELRLYIANKDAPLTETWLYQFEPPATA